MKYIFILNLLILSLIASCGLYVEKFLYYEFSPVVLNYEIGEIEIIVSPLKPNESEDNTSGSMVGGDYGIALYSKDKIKVSKIELIDTEDNSKSHIFDNFKELNSFNGPYQYAYGVIDFKKYKALINFEYCSISGCNSQTMQFNLVPVKAGRKELPL